jgi:two-component system cell cycle sensor histidine kinase/response regulator CckA
LRKRSVLITALGAQISIRDSAAAIRDDQSLVIGTVIVFRNALETREAEDAHRKAGEIDRQALQIDAIGKLAGGVAHDLNNALAIILGNSDLLLSGLAPDSQWRQGIQAIGKAARRAADLTAQLLSFGRRQMLRPSMEDLSGLVAGSAGAVGRLVGDKIAVRFKLEPKLPPIYIDSARFQQVMLNLAANARDAMPSGGVFAIETAMATVDRTDAPEHPRLFPGGYVTLTVSDTGYGMTEETLAHLFEPFFTTKETGRGAGMGLATVYGFVRQSGGGVTVSSEEGKGSTFRIYFPVAEKTAEPPGSVADEPQSKGTQGPLLLVEDEQDVRHLIQRMLEQNGYRVLSAANGREGCEVFERHASEIALVISDVLMPELTGPEMAKRINKLRPDMKFLFVSATSETGANPQAFPRSAALLQKPFLQEDLLRLVRDQLTKRS